MVGWMDAMRVTGFIEPAENESWKIECFEVTRGDQIFQLGSLFSTGRSVPPGNYTKLMRKRIRDEKTYTKLVMSDAPDELRDHYGIYAQGKGRVLINGLGLGCVIKGLLMKDVVEHIDVVEISQDLINLVGPYYVGDRVTIHHGDAFTYKWPKNTRWDVAWHDVWDDLNTDNLTQVPHSYAALNRRYGGRVEWQGAWGQEWLKHRRRQEDSRWSP